MAITPLDVRRQQFRVVWRGYDREEVDAFLAMIADELEKIHRDTITMQERLRLAESSMNEYRSMEATLKETLVTAQKAADDTKANAKKEADLIVREAEIKAEQQLEEARRQVAKIQQELVLLKDRQDGFVSNLKSICQAQMDFLERFKEGHGTTG
ncbi:MAG: DivIVA domain-containing protein [Candidatus Latescibacteria bacterium]|nr:DivIVA domain-containing protein [Candidatus Latescibacterota bacterium]